MKSTYLTLSVAVCFSALAAAQENYSLWPRRPAELEQAQHLIRQREYDEALRLLAPFVHKSGLAGHESRQLAGAIQVRRYLSTESPLAVTHVVKRGEHIERIASQYKSSADLIILINALMDPSALRVGQKLRVIPQTLRAELHPANRELSVWDGQNIVAVYDVLPSRDLHEGENAETSLKEREGYIGGARTPRSSALFVASNRTLKLADGTTLTGGENAPKSKVVRMHQRDINELSLLLGQNARVSIVRQEKSFDPYPGTAPPQPDTANK